MGKYGFNKLNMIMKGSKESLTTAKGQTKVALVKKILNNVFVDSNQILNK